jgi:XTP/dITP diphosphohydrolase
MEGVANSFLQSRGVRQLVFASHDERVVSKFRESIRPFGIEVVSLAEFGLPDRHSHDPHRTRRRDDVLLSATSKAAVVAAITDLPTIGLARGFYIDPLLRWSGGGPQRYWPIPWPWANAQLGRELGEADDALNASGYLGAHDRGAYFRTVLCLVWPDAESETFEGRVKGRFETGSCFKRIKELVGDPARYFIPEGETVALARLAKEALQQYSDQARAFEAFRRALPG